MAQPARSSRSWLALAAGQLAAILAAIGMISPATTGADDLQPGYTTRAYAIDGAKVWSRRGVVFDPGTVVVRDGVIESVGPSDDVAIPYDAEVIDGEDLVVYPGFLDLYTTLGAAPGIERSATGSGQSIPFEDFAMARTPMGNRDGLTPEFEVAGTIDLPDRVVSGRRELGFTDALAAPGGAIATGQSALITLDGAPRRDVIVRAPIALHINLQPPLEPGSVRTSGDPSTVEFHRISGYPVSLMGAIAHLRQAMLDADYHRQALDNFEAHGGPRPAFDPALDALARARRDELAVWWEAETRDQIHRALNLAEEFGTSAVIVGGREAAEVADRLKERDVPVVLRLDFPEKPKVPTKDAYRKKDAKDRTEPLRVLEDRARRWEERVGTAAALDRAEVKFAFCTNGIEKVADFPKKLRDVLKAGLSEDSAIEALTSHAAEIAGLGERTGTIEPGKLDHLIALSAPISDEKAKVRFLLIDGQKFDLDNDEDREGTDENDTSEKPDDETDKEGTSSDEPAEEPRRPGAESMKQEPRQPRFVDVASELDEDRKPTMHTGGNVLIKDAVILTVSEAGTIPRGSILIRDGKIDAIGPDLEAPDGVMVLDAAGMVAMPGIIDTHSHMAISGGANESSRSIVPEVRVADVVDGEDTTIFRAAAGGVTAARLLHGSANTIGGQDVVIKLRFGRPGHELILHDESRPQGVKFALGENVTRNRSRFPNTRMGVEAVIERAFQEGIDYDERREAHENATRSGEPSPPFRRDLRLEALAAIVDGSFKIHSHCYRSDEILMLLRVAERYGVRVQSLQHVLEGYKVAPEIAAHGASASTFSDWWAYKVEAYDAIPYNAALLTEAGVQVCIKSDSNELVRHLNLEASKMVKYGGVTEAQALKMITLNPARELGLEHRLGSLEPGKDADIALFNAHPLDSYARCELTLIDGEVAFQRTHDGSLTPRDGDHVRMPQPSPEALGRKVEVPPSAEGTYALTNATLHPVSGPPIERGTVVISDGRFAAVGGPETAIPSNATRIDLNGLDVWPGMIDCASQIGLFEIGSLSETRDYADSADFQPELRTSVAIHPDSEIIPVTRLNGILSAFVLPEGGLISGRGCVIDLAGWVPPEMVVDDLTALSVGMPNYVHLDPNRGRRSGDNDPNRRRREQLENIAEMFRKAKRYGEIVAKAEERGDEAPAPDPRLIAMLPYARGEKPVVFRADGQVEILDALEMAEELELKAIISGGAEAWKVAGALRRADVPVLLNGTLRLPSERVDPYDAPYSNPSRLHDAGVRFAIRSSGSSNAVTNARNQPFEAAVAVAYGLPEDAALRAVTLSPAEILGVADKLGSIDVGKRANLVVTAGPLLQVTTAVKALFIAGKPIELESRHTRLYAKYRHRLAEVRAGEAPLGLDRPSEEDPYSSRPTVEEEQGRPAERPAGSSDR